MKKLRIIIFILFVCAFVNVAHAETKDLLTPEESLWLKSRNNTIVVYPEKNNPPYSYTSAAGNVQGLSIDYIELIAEKIGAKIEYLNPQPLNQILNDVPQGKGDIVADLMETDERGSDFIFTDSFITVPTVIVTRKDFERKNSLTLNDFNGKRISVISGTALEKYIHKNYPRVIIEEVTDDEVSLQQVVLGEVDAAALDVASLSFYLSKQVLSSVKIVGNTGFEYKPAFGLLKNKTILQSILDKGMTQISTSDRALLTDKWIVVPDQNTTPDSFFTNVKDNFAIVLLYLLASAVVIIIVIFLRKNSWRPRHLKKIEDIHALKAESEELAAESDTLNQELQEIKLEEEQLKEKIRSLEK